MALVSTSQNVTDQDATPIAKVNVQKKGGVIRSAIGYLAAASMTGGTTGQWYTFVRIPVNAIVKRIKCTNLTSTTGAVKCGLYRPGGIAISDAVFATAFVLGAANNAAQVDTVLTALQRTQTIATAFATAISTAGATGDAEVDIALGIATVIGTPVDVTVEVEYVLPN
jgi:hypothetical protein